MESLQTLLESANTPIVTAFLLGILTAISPCPLATNITAIGFISKDIESRRRIFWGGMLYTLGRVVAYTALGVVLISILREGASVFAIQKTIGKYSEMLIAPTLILIGLFMFFGSRLNLRVFGFGGGGGQKLKQKGGLGAFLLGFLFALTFCPTSGVFYFGMLIPMSAAEAEGYLLPAVFAVATGLPVVIVAWILAFSVGSLGRFYNRMQAFQRWFYKVTASIFIGVGIYYLIILYF